MLTGIESCMNKEKRSIQDQRRSSWTITLVTLLNKYRMEHAAAIRAEFSRLLSEYVPLKYAPEVERRVEVFIKGVNNERR